MCIIFIKLVSQMEHYLTIWFNTGNLYRTAIGLLTLK